MKKEENKKPAQTSSDTYPGVAVDIGDDEKTSAALEKERTEVLGNNPRNNDI